MKILNYGSLNYDFVYSLTHMVQPGETITSDSMEKFCGGKGLNQSIALARAGANVYHAGMVGSDGAQLMETCKENGVNTTFIEEVEGVSGHAIIQLNREGENSIILYAGANRKNTVEHIQGVLEHFDEGDVLLLQNEINELETLVEKAYQKGMQIVLNPSPFDNKLNESIFEKVSLFILNEIEGEQLTGKKNPEDILVEISRKYPNARIMLTLGCDGSIFQEKASRIRCASYHVPVVDTTAAGDTFTGYFVAAMTEGKTMEIAMEEATEAAALAVMKKGAVASIPTRQDVKTATFRR